MQTPINISFKKLGVTPLDYIETSLFGEEYKPNGVLTVANRPHITNNGREWFGNITMENGLIKNVK